MAVLRARGRAHPRLLRELRGVPPQQADGRGEGSDPLSWAPGAGTQVTALIGDPARHSLSPTIFNGGYRALDLDWTHLVFEVGAGGGAGAVAAMRALSLRGLNVTMPQKEEVAAAVDRLSPIAAELGAVNVVAWQGNELVGHNTDGEGFVAALRTDENVDPAGLRCLVIGAGGAARAVIKALAIAGAAEIVVVARRPEAAASAAALAGMVGRVGEGAQADIAQLVVNATPVGMSGVAAIDPGVLPIDEQRLGPGQVVVDLVYNPLRTPLLEAAQRRGAVAVGGVGMLLHQAGAAFELWTGQPAPLTAMSAAVLAELARRQESTRSD